MLRSAPTSLAALALVAGLALPAAAQTPEGAVEVPMAEVEWTEIVPGVDFGAVYGDMMAEAHGKLVRFDPGMVSPTHTHTHAYRGVVIRGAVINPYGDDGDPVEMGPGDYWYVPGGAPHRTGCVSEEPCLFWTYGDAAWDIQIVEEAPPAESR